MNKSTLSRWQSIGVSEVIKINQSKLPSSFGALYNLTVLERSYESHFGNGQGRNASSNIWTRVRLHRPVEGMRLQSF